MAPLVLQPHSCVHCQNLVVDLSRRGRRRDDGDMADRGTMFDCTFWDIKSGAGHGCQFFTWLMDSELISRETVIGFSPNDLPEHDPYWKVLDALQDSAMWISEFLGPPQPHNTLRNVDPDESSRLEHHRLFASTYQSSGSPLDLERIQFFGLWNPDTLKIDYRTRDDFQVFTQPDDPASRSVSTRPIEQEPGSSTTLARISDWLTECQTGHTDCQYTYRSEVMPSRLIEISRKDDLQYSLRLRGTQQLGTVPFAALSYCWGIDQPFKCRECNLSKLMTEILFSNLPPTLQDAIVVSQRLKIDYLWVDALCIVQDIEQDKTSEIAKMPYIYGNAVLTFALARASSVNDGFLHERAVDPGTIAFRLPYRCQDSQVGSITLVDIEVTPEPIDERGWTLQERLLSRRVVELGSRQTRWFCQREGPNPEQADGWRAAPEYSPLRKDTTGVVQSQKMRDLHPARDYGFIVGHWNTVVSAYTQRKLSLPTDRAQAISGIAEIFGQLLTSQYKAGLWTSAMHSALLWQISAKHRMPRPTVHQGPSWSWTSVNGKVEFGSFNVNDWRHQDCQAKILDVDCSLVDDTAPFGAIRDTSGQLTLRARTAIGARIVSQGAEHEQAKFSVGFWGTNGAGICIAHARMSSDAIEEDFSEEGSNDKEDGAVTVVELQSRIRGHSWQCRGLVLRRITTRDGYFRRVGTFEYVTGRENRGESESADDFETRVALELDWFRHQPYVSVVIV